MSIFSICLTASFLVHELAHKITAQKRGLWAEFRLTTWGTIMTIISVFLPFKMIAPGAMMISGPVDKKSMLKISIAGPITNIILAPVFFTVSLVLQQTAPGYSFVLGFAGFISAFMAIWNLIPFGPLDGLKILSADKKAWVSVFIPSLVLTIYGYLYCF
jgi:Zn-dependent protease